MRPASAAHIRLHNELIEEDDGDSNSDEEDRRQIEMKMNHMLSGVERKQLKRRTRSTGKEKDLHPSLHKAVHEDHAATAREEQLRIRATSALAGNRAQIVYREHRPASAASVFVRSDRPPDTVKSIPVEQLSPRSRFKEGRLEKPPTPRGMKRAFGVGRTGEIWDGKQYCILENCKLIGNEDHMSRFMHVCPMEDSCTRRHDKEHTKYYTHGQTAEEIERIRDWKKLPNPMPDRNAALYQRFQQPPALCPRFGHRPAGGSKFRTELRELKKGEGQETVVVEVSGLDLTWDNKGFAEYVRDHCSFRARVIDTKVYTGVGGLSIGSGRIVVGCYEDAQLVIESLHGKQVTSTGILSAKYQQPFVAEKENVRVTTTFNEVTPSRPKIDLAVRKYNQGIRACGAYVEDAMALKKRMESEGHEPDMITYTHLVRSMRDAQPPLPKKAEQLLRDMVAKGLKPTAMQCNLVLEAWTLSGNMKHAERFAEEMESDSRNREDLALPTEDTYHILADGWERLGVMDEIKDRQALTQKKGQPSCLSKKLDRIAVIGANSPANKTTTLWARKRSGYLSIHSGIISAAADHRFKQFVPNNNLANYKWRSKD